jgi:hypothetical protein
MHKKPGAKPRPPSLKHSKRVQVSLSPSDADSTFVTIRSLHITQSEYIRRALASFHAHLDATTTPGVTIKLPRRQRARVLTGSMPPAEFASAIQHARMQGLRAMSEHVRRALAHFQQTLESEK